MRHRKGGYLVRILSAAVLAALSLAAAGAQAPPTFPAQQRGPGDAALVARGNAIYTLNCRACHGVDLRGGDLGGPNLLRSQLVLNDQKGEAIGPVVRAGRVPAGGGTAMPALALSDEDVKAVAEYIHNVTFTSRPQGAPPAGAAVTLNLLVGNARAGERYFKNECAACHSVGGDLAGIGARITSIETLQNTWVAGRRLDPPASDPARRAVRVTVKFADGQMLDGTLQRLDDFVVSFTTDQGEYRSFVRRSAQPAITSIDVKDPTARHRELWTKLSDADMHDVTAYLATLK
jgi:cytochrome c oxidase cbb3-type subunit 3